MVRHANNKQGARHLLQHRHQCGKFAKVLLFRANKQVKFFGHAAQLFKQHRDHRRNRVRVRAQARLGLSRRRQREQRGKPLHPRGCLGGFLKQVEQRFYLPHLNAVRKSVDASRTQLRQTSVNVPQPANYPIIEPQRTPCDTFNQGDATLAKEPHCRTSTQLAKCLEHLAQQRQVVAGFDLLQYLLQRATIALTQFHRVGDTVELLEIGRHIGLHSGQNGKAVATFSRAVLRLNRLFTTNRTQVVDDREQQCRVVRLLALDAIEKRGDLQDGLHEYFLRSFDVVDRLVHQGLRKGLHLLSNLGRALQFHHSQGAVDLMQCREARTHTRRVRRILRYGFERGLSLLQDRGNLTLDPVQRDKIL